MACLWLLIGLHLSFQLQLSFDCWKSHFQLCIIELTLNYFDFTGIRCWVARNFTVCRTHTRTLMIISHALPHRTSIFDDRTRTRTFLHFLDYFVFEKNISIWITTFANCVEILHDNFLSIPLNFHEIFLTSSLPNIIVQIMKMLDLWSIRTI